MMSASLKRVFAIGSANVDVLFHVDRLPARHEKLRVNCPVIVGGGSAANTACWLAYLNRPVTALIGVADDMFAEFTVSSLKNCGVAVEYGQPQKGARSGIAVILSSGTDKRMIIGGSTVLITDEMIASLDVSSGDHMHFVSADPHVARRIVMKASEHGATVSSEFNGGWFPERVESCDVCFSNMDDLRRAGLSYDQLARCARDWARSSLLVVTDGARRVMCVSAAGVAEEVVEFVAPVDRTGAGDAFDAGFLHSWIDRQPIDNCLRSGLEVAKAAVLRNGARPVSQKRSVP